MNFVSLLASQNNIKRLKEIGVIHYSKNFRNVLDTVFHLFQ
jgi:hypothetical protein